MLTNKVVLITGGTGSLGKKLVKRLMEGELGTPKKIIIFSRDEAKQHDMKVEWKHMQLATDEIFYGNFEDILEFRIGNIRDYHSVVDGLKDSDIVINAAALKQVPVCEYFPFEAVKTNILGAENIVKAIRQTANNIELVLNVSTDKACKPINTYGMTKAIQERIMLEANYSCKQTKFICVRYGNVMASRGSIIPLFQNQIMNGGPITITTKDMTRFMMSLDQAVDTIFAAITNANPGETYIPIVKSAFITDLADVMIADRNIETKIIGIRPGEKIHEILISEEEISRTTKRDDYYVIHSILPEIRKTNIEKAHLLKEFSSKDNVISKEELRILLEKEGHIN
jgi:UDP-glucose 4-epimerase